VNLDAAGKPIDKRRLFLVVILPLACAVAAAAIFLPQSLVRLAVIFVIALPVIALCLDRPRIVFFALVLLLFSNIDAYAPFRLYRVVLAFFFAAFALSLVRGRRLVGYNPVVIMLFTAFAIVAMMSLGVARDLPTATTRYKYLLKWMLAVFIMAQFATSRRDFKWFILVAVVGMLMSNFLPLVISPPSKFASLSVMWSQGVVRYEGFVFEPNTFAMFQIYLIPLLMFLFAVYRRPLIARPIFAAAIVASIVVLVMSFSRGGFIALVCTLLMLIILEHRNKVILVVGLIMIVATAVYSPAVYWERIQSILNSSLQVQDFSVFTRFETMKTALRLAMAHPIFGVGIDNFIYQSAYYIPYKLTVHNTPLQIFAEVGAPGFALFVAIVCYNLVILKRLMTRVGDPEASLVGRMLFIQQLAVVINSLFIPTSWDMIFWFTLGLPGIAANAYRLPAGESVGAPAEAARADI
jgi:O-antigen ligase